MMGNSGLGRRKNTEGKNRKIMKLIKSGLLVISSVGLIILGACSNENQAIKPSNSPAASPEVAANKPAQTTNNGESKANKAGHSNKNQGGQVIESGNYHLELVTLKEDNGTHIDFYLQKGDNHEAIADAKVTAQVQSPTGEQKTLNLAYDVAGKHYAAVLPDKTAGEYKVAVLSDIKGEKVNGRFTFKR